MAHIVIIGAGSGGLPMAYQMDELARPGDRVTVVSHTLNSHFAYLSPWGPVNAPARSDIEFALAPRLERMGIGFTGAGARRVHPESNRVELGTGAFLDYDFLVIASGPRLAFEEIEGLGPNGHTQCVCHVNHAAASGKAWEQFVTDPGPIVVGAVQGASCFGPAYEFAFIMETDLRRRELRDRAPMTFVTAEPHIGHLGLGGVGDSRTLLESALRDRHIGWITNATVTRVEAGRMYLVEHGEDGRPKQDHVLPFKYSMMLPASRGIDAVSGIDGLADPRGFILIDEFQRNPKYRNIYAVGVAVAIAPAKPTPVPTGAPRTGYMIESMVAAAAHNIRDRIDGKEPSHKASWNTVCLADLGDTGIAFVAQPQTPPSHVNWFSEGKWLHVPRCSSCDVGF